VLPEFSSEINPFKLFCSCIETVHQIFCYQEILVPIILFSTQNIQSQNGNLGASKPGGASNERLTGAVFLREVE
jgi:hypothetical protein